MGNAFPNEKDPGRVNYREHNIYLNFLNSYSRLPPATPITIHQKALFILWMSSIFIWLLLKSINLIKKFITTKSSCDRDLEEVGLLSELDINKKDDLLLTKTPTEPNVIPDSIKGTPNKKHWTESELYASPTRTNGSPSKRKDYLDESAFTASPNGPTQQSDSLKINASEKIQMGVRKVVEQITEKMHEEESPVKQNYFNVIKTNITRTIKSKDDNQPTFEDFIFKMAIFGCFMFYFWLTDYLHIWPKVDKQYSRDIFIFLFFILVFVAVVFTIKKTKDKLLNRDQTEEWKGWMQVQFVWYHYFDASETYNSIRCYVGAYVWMTGFGNFIYFYTRKDYSIFRLLKMLFRLNFLVFCVMAVTSHEFVRYYICAMHTYWFLSVWAVTVAMNRYNENPKFIYLKFFIYAVINAIIFNTPGLSEIVFTPLKWALHDHDGTLKYWKYRAKLDHWSTLVGMLVGFHFAKIENFLTYLDKSDKISKSQRETLRYAVTAILLAIFAVWFYYVLPLPKASYLEVHPFTSPVPIVIYALLRNMHPILRTHYLNLFTWLGKITLETYLSQIHIYMMGDAKAILVYLPRYPMLNFTVSTLIYIGVSYVLFKLTVFFSSYIFPRNGQVVIKNLILGTLWILTCYSFAYMLTRDHIWKSKNSGLEFLLWNITKY